MRYGFRMTLPNKNLLARFMDSLGLSSPPRSLANLKKDQLDVTDPAQHAQLLATP